MAHVYLLLGANLGDREQQMQAAWDGIAASIGLIIKASGLYETESWGSDDKQPDYLNQVLLVETAQAPLSVLKEINVIEARLGRVRKKKWDARIIDIDILFYENQIVDLPQLQIPHPYFQERNFALVPMNEIAPDYIHPILSKSVNELLHDSADALRVKPFYTQRIRTDTNAMNEHPNLMSEYPKTIKS